VRFASWSEEGIYKRRPPTLARHPIRTHEQSQASPYQVLQVRDLLRQMREGDASPPHGHDARPSTNGLPVLLQAWVGARGSASRGVSRDMGSSTSTEGDQHPRLCLRRGRLLWRQGGQEQRCHLAAWHRALPMASRSVLVHASLSLTLRSVDASSPFGRHSCLRREACRHGVARCVHSSSLSSA
jgi:hypothetical protein